MIILLLGQCLSERICKILFSGYSFYLYIFPFYDFSNYMESPKYMFESLMRPWFLCLCNGSIVVTVHGYWINNVRNHAKFSNELLDPNNLFCPLERIDVFNFNCKICYGFLFGTLPTHNTFTQSENIS